LGAPEVWNQHQLLKFPTRKSLALLVYLAVAGGWHSREKLTALLWPESPGSQGQASLRNGLIRLRRTLGKTENYLLVDADLLSFDLTGHVTLDLQAITAAGESSTVAVLQKAVEQYRADFLEGFSLPDAPDFEEWASLQREYWRRQMSEILARLSQLQTDHGQMQQGLDTALRWRTHDPLNEAAHRRVMELYATAGDKTAALQAYQRCRATLAAELAIEPSPETAALAEHIQNSRSSPLNFEWSRDNPKSKIQNPKWIELPFVGRSIKHLQLVTAFHTTRQQQPQLVIIEGEAGIGKTRLATEFLAWAAVQGADILQGRAFEAGGRLPYQPLIEALGRRMEQENAPEDLLSDIWLAELSRLLPELRERYPDLPLPAENENEARTHLLEAVARLGQALAKRQRPVVIFIDDIQWADVASLDMLHYCSRAWAEAGSPILLLLAIRSEAIATASSLHDWLANLERTISGHHLSLGSLTLEDTRRMAQALVGREDAAALSLAQRLGDWLFAETEGQPFFISETIKELVTQGILQSRLNQAGLWEIEPVPLETWLAAGSSITPRGVRQLIKMRLNRLTPLALNLLTATAVLGRHCSYTRLVQVAGVDEGAGLSGLDELLNAYLLSETGNAGQPYTIAHDKIREVVYDEAGPARRRLFHQRAFEALETASVLPAELAYHALGAHLAEPALRYSQAAGDNALALFAVPDAITYYEQARTLIIQRRLPLVGNLLLNLGRAYELAGDLRQAGTIYQELWQQLQRSSQPDLACTVLNRLAMVAVHGYDFEMATGYLQQAQRMAEASGNKPGLAETEWSLAQLYHHRFDFRQSLVHSRRTLALARELNDARLVASSLNALAYAQMLLGQVSAGETAMIEARTMYAGLGNKALEADCLSAIAAAQMWQGRIHEGVETARIAEAICAEIDNPWGQIYSWVWLATGLLDIGEAKAALAVAQAGQDLARAHHLPPMRLFIALVLGKVYRALGQLEVTYQVHLEALTLNEQIKSAGHAELIRAELCTDCALVGNWAQATIYAREALAYRKYDVLPLVIPARWPETQALLQAGEIELAREDSRRWGERVAHLPRFRLPHLRSLAVLAQWQGDREQAMAYLQEASRLAKQMGLPGEQEQILALLAEL
jgi:DNA-binding SARP family transcriptional activator/tetratricopeptide (TPR) repeat protein